MQPAGAYALLHARECVHVHVHRMCADRGCAGSVHAACACVQQTCSVRVAAGMPECVHAHAHAHATWHMLVHTHQARPSGAPPNRLPTVEEMNFLRGVAARVCAVPDDSPKVMHLKSPPESARGSGRERERERGSGPTPILALSPTLTLSRSCTSRALRRALRMVPRAGTTSASAPAFKRSRPTRSTITCPAPRREVTGHAVKLDRVNRSPPGSSGQPLRADQLP